MKQRVDALRHEAGFTIIEVLVAATLLVIGVLATVKVLDGANAAAVVTRDRVAGINLARDVVEAARNIDYDQLICSSGTTACSDSDAAIAALKGQSGLGSTSGTSWTVVRSGITYTIGPVKVCKVDETRDSLGANDPSDPAFCATYTCPTASVTTCADTNPDDYRKLDVTVTWTPGSGITGRKSVRQVALLTNPSGGVGPSIKTGPCALSAAATSTTTACPTTPITLYRESARPACDGTHSTPSNPAACVAPPPTCNVSPCVPFWLQTSSADTSTVHWSVDDGRSSGDGSALNGSTFWGVNWPLGSLNTSVVNPFTLAPAVCTGSQPAPIFTLAAAQGVVLDGNYLVTFQAFDGLGVPGALKTLSVTLNRFAPAIPCPLLGGYNVPDSSTGNPSSAEFEWTANVERDIKNYNVYWAGPDALPDIISGNSNDVKVCSSVTTSSCRDDSPSSHGLGSVGSTAVFFVTAVDTFDSESRPSLLLTVTRPLIPNTPPNVPRAADGSNNPPDYAIVSGQPTLTWSIDPSKYPSGRLDPDLTDTVIKYRIYRDGTAYANRIAAITMPTGGTTATFSDTNAPAGSHTYYVTAVDSRYQESAPAGPVP